MIDLILVNDMKAIHERSSRTIKFAELGDKHIDQFDVTVNYVDDDSSRCGKAVILDNKIIPNIVKSFNDHAWKPIAESSIPITKMIVAIAKAKTAAGRDYVTDPYCVWLNEDGSFSRWPHYDTFGPPTHFLELPEFNA